jgi:hypothetical protein
MRGIASIKILQFSLSARPFATAITANREKKVTIPPHLSSTLLILAMKMLVQGHTFEKCCGNKKAQALDRTRANFILHNKCC